MSKDDADEGGADRQDEGRAGNDPIAEQEGCDER